MEAVPEAAAAGGGGKEAAAEAARTESLESEVLACNARLCAERGGKSRPNAVSSA